MQIAIGISVKDCYHVSVPHAAYTALLDLIQHVDCPDNPLKFFITDDHDEALSELLEAQIVLLCDDPRLARERVKVWLAKTRIPDLNVDDNIAFVRFSDMVSGIRNALANWFPAKLEPK